MRIVSAWLFCIVLVCPLAAHAEEAAVDFDLQIAPLLKKHCAGCHNDQDREGKFSLESYAALMQGVDHRAAVLPGDAAGSRLWRVLTPGNDPQMPPEGEPAPSAQELQLIQTWIEQGAKGPSGLEPDRLTMQVPKIPTLTKTNPVTAIAVSPGGTQLAVGTYGQIEIRAIGAATSAADEEPPLHVLSGLPGKVESLHFCNEGRQLISASGVSGSGGLATLWDVETGARVQEFRGHRDIIFDAEISPDGTLLATCSYDRNIILWDVQSGLAVRTLSGHNGAVYDIAFHPTGAVLASASADDTCKLWRVRDGERLDTLGQPLKEQYAISFTRDGQFVIAAGADNQIRVWKIISTEKPAISPLVQARFAHDAPIVSLQFTPDGSRLITAAEDRSLKVWETQGYTELAVRDNQPDVVDALAVLPERQAMAVGRMNGTWEIVPLPEAAAPVAVSSAPAMETPSPSESTRPPQSLVDQEPNNSASQAQQIELPAVITGVVHSPDQPTDVDAFRFHAAAGEEWVIDVTASRENSPLDSFVDVIHVDGTPVPRAVLQAVRDSYFTFRAKNGDQSDDFRVFQWEEMSLNDLLYCNGEVVKLWRSPRGPDSGYDVYPGEGKRWGYFDTSGLTHALNDPCYIVRAYPADTVLVSNGLPQFKVNFENDDAARRESGKDSKLFFTAPQEGDYVVRIRDVRGTHGPDFKYRMAIRRAAPDFAVTLSPAKLEMAPNSRAELRFQVDRKDQFDGPVVVELNGLPPGFSFQNPVVIEAEQSNALGLLSAETEAAAPTAEQLAQIEIVAGALIRGKDVSHPVKGIEELKFAADPKFRVAIQPIDGGAVPVANPEGGPLEFEIHPGETIMLKVVAERNGFQDLIEFGTADCGRNLPHGVYVDNIGLNGLMLPAGQSEQKVFITADDWIPEQFRLFHLRTTNHNRLATPPVMLHVRRQPEKSVAQP